MYISREQAEKILKEHGLDTKETTGVDQFGFPIFESTFNHEMGIHKEYKLEEVYKWLGY